MKTRYAKWRVSITLMTAQLVAGYLRGKPRSRSMHAATIKEHIKCTGYCRRDPYRQLLVSCCQPRRWTSRTYSPILGVPLQTDFPNWKLARYNILILFNSPLIRRIFYICELLRRFSLPSGYFIEQFRIVILIFGEQHNKISAAHIHSTISKSVNKVSISTERTFTHDDSL